VLAAFLAGWEALGRSSGGKFLPPFGETVTHWLGLAHDGELWPALLASNESLLLGFPLSVLLGVPLGLLFGRRRVVDRAFSYYLDILLVVPMISVVPIVIVALGLGTAARVAVVVLFALPVISLNARAAVRVVDEALIEMARSFNAGPLRIWFSIILPAALGPIFTGLRLGLSRAVSGMIVIELTLIPTGLGGLMMNYRAAFAAADLYAVTLTVLVEGVLLVTAAQYLERAINRRLQGVHG
jgi:ABC-type nitrate/sulfonate/bicarbonate transport system permease component